MTAPTVAICDGVLPEMTEREIQIYFLQRPDVIFPISERMTLEQLVIYWADHGFDDVSPDFELEIVKAVLTRLEQLDPHHVNHVLGEHGGLLARFDASCKHPESVRLLKAFGTQMLHPPSAPHAHRGHHPEMGPSMIGGSYEATY